MVAQRKSTPPNVWWVGLVCGMASFIDAAAIIGFGITMVIFQSSLELNELEVGVASGALTFGVAVGALVGGRLGDYFGRRPVFTATMILILAALVGLFFVQSFPLLLTSALLLGLGAGADLPVSLSTISEAATDENRGKILGFSNLLWLAGAIITSVFASSVAAQGRAGAQIIFATLGAVTLLVLAGRLTIPESDDWIKAREEKKLGVDTVRADRARTRELFRKPYLVPLLALAGFYTLTNLAANTSGQYSSYILVNYGGVPLETAAVLGLPALPLTVLAFLWFMRIADKPVRFRYFTVGAVFMVASSLVIVFFGVSVPTYLVSAALQSLGSAFAFEGIMKVWTQTTFPTLLRTTAQGFVIATARFVAAAFAGITPMMLTLGPSVLYGILAALSFVGLSWAWIVFRTRDRQNIFDTESQIAPERDDVDEPEGAAR